MCVCVCVYVPVFSQEVRSKGEGVADGCGCYYF